MKKVDQLNGLIFFLTSLVICSGSANLSYGSLHNPGPGFFPFWIGVSLGCMSIGLYFKSTLEKGGKKIRELFAEKVRWKKVLLVLITLIIYGSLMDYIGFLMVTFLFLLSLLRFIDPQRWRAVIGWALFGSLGSYLVFEVWLKLRLPKGLLGI